MWSRRAQEYEAKISSGKIYELAEVVRDLNKGDDLMVDQSYSERQLFEKAYERILSEFQIVMGISLEDTQKKLDKALKRNLEGKAKKKAIVKVKKKNKVNVNAKLTKKIISVKKAKVTKKTTAKIKKNLKAVSAKSIPQKVDLKTDNLRISKSNEVKPEIKKVKKQETEKKEYKVKDYVVYPKHGVGQITEFKKINIGGIDVETYVLKFEKDKANGMVPVNKQSHLRPLATINQVNKCVSILKSKPKIKRSMWSRRAQEYEAKISSGKIYELAEVVRDLNKGDDLMVDQSYSERQLFEKAYERILSEFQIVMGVSLEDTQKKLDKALKRNLEGQTKDNATPTKIVEL
jgi:CarD family transcriptional regulator